MKILLQLFLGTCLANLEPLFFDLNGRETRCFIEEMPNETMMTGKYHAKENGFPTRFNRDSLKQVKRYKAINRS